MSDIFENTFNKHKQLLFESISDQNWEDRVDWEAISNSVNFADSIPLEDFFSLKKEEYISDSQNVSQSPRFANHITKRFQKDFAKLPDKIKRESKYLYEIFKKNPFDPRLRFHKIVSLKDYVAVNAGAFEGKVYRSIGKTERDSNDPGLTHIHWFFIGGHSYYDDAISRLKKI